MDPRELFRRWLDRNRDKVRRAQEVFGGEAAFLDVIHQRLTCTLPGEAVIRLLAEPPNAETDKRIADYIDKVIGTEAGRRPRRPASPPDEGMERFEDDGAVPVPGEVREAKERHYADPGRFRRQTGEAPSLEEEEIMANDWAGGGELPPDDAPRGPQPTRGGRAPELDISKMLDEWEADVDKAVATRAGMCLPVATQPLLVETNGGRNRFVFRRKDVVAAFCVSKQPGVNQRPTDEVDGSCVVLTGGARLASPGPELFDFVAEALQARKILWPVVDDEEDES
jgi:hypothetical protein